MSKHEIPDDGHPHSATTECGCGPQLRRAARQGAPPRRLYAHMDMTGATATGQQLQRKH